MIRNSDIQFQSPEAIRAFQEERMQETIRYVAGHSEFYRSLFAQAGIVPSRFGLSKICGEYR